MTNSGLEEAQVILVGVSRCGKTPTSIYLAMQFGIKAANYPLIPEDFERGNLPAALMPHINKIFGLTIRPERLHSVLQAPIFISAIQPRSARDYLADRSWGNLDILHPTHDRVRLRFRDLQRVLQRCR